MSGAGAAWLAVAVVDVLVLNLWALPELRAGGDRSAAPPPVPTAALAVAPRATTPLVAAVAAPTPTAVVPPTPTAAVEPPAVEPPPVEPPPVEPPAVEPPAVATPPAPAPAAVAAVAAVEPAPAPTAVAAVEPAVEPDVEPAVAPAPAAPPRSAAAAAVSVHAHTAVVRFGFDRATITPRTARQLDEIAAALASQPDRAIVIDAYATPEGDADHNLRLSQRRARRLRDYLVERGVAPDQVVANGRGTVDAQGRVAVVHLEAAP